MAENRPQLPFTTPLRLLIPTYETVKGTTVKKFPAVSTAPIIFASFKTYGGTETTVNDVYTLIDTADIETWFRPDIRSDCEIVRAVDGARYEIINEPENISMRNQFLKFKVQRVKGGA